MIVLGLERAFVRELREYDRTQVTVGNSSLLLAWRVEPRTPHTKRYDAVQSASIRCLHAWRKFRRPTTRLNYAQRFVLLVELNASYRFCLELRNTVQKLRNAVM